MTNTGRIIVAAFCGASAMGWMNPPVDAAPPASEPYAWNSVTIKANGFINGVVYHPTEKGLIYINTDMGGAYRHDADTGRWSCLTDWITHDDWSLNQMGVETIAVDPTDANRVYAGVGTYMGPSAVLRSSDHGRTWERTDVPFPMNGNGSARQTGQRLNVDPNQPSRLVYGTRTMGLWESGDRGATWSRVESFPATGEKDGPTREAGVVWTLFDKSSASSGEPTRTLYAGVMTVGQARVFRSTDAGATWEPIPGQPGGELLPNRAALTPDGTTLYITYVTSGGYPGPHGLNGGSVFKVTDPASGAPTWTEVAPVARGTFGYSGVSLDPTDPPTVFVTTIHRYGDPGDDIYRTTDAGQTWTPLHINDHRDDSSAPYASLMGMHWTGDVQVCPHDPNEAMFTTGWGLYRTMNLKDTTPTWAFYNEGFEQSAVLELVSPTSGSAHLLSAIGDRDGYRHEDFAVSPVHGLFGQPNSVGQTERMSMGTNHDIDAALHKPEIVVRVGGAPQFSHDGGLTWHWFGGKAPERGEGARPGPSDGSIALSPDGDRVVWAPGGRSLGGTDGPGGVRYATRSGDGWSDWTVAQGAPAETATVVADPVAAGTFYLRGRAALFASTDGGATWTKRSDLPERPSWLRAAPAPGAAGHLWLNAGDEGALGLHRSTDGGTTWTRVAPDLVSVAKQVGVGAPRDAGGYPAIFVGGTVGGLKGFFRSDDEGQTWVRINDDAHHYGNVIVINGDSRVHGRLYVGTNGRGILYGERAFRAAQ